MTDEQPRADRPRTSPRAPVTGVAKGNLGTATNLEDTQEYSVAELLGNAPAPAQPAAAVEAPPPPAAPIRIERPRQRATVGAAPAARSGLTRSAGLAVAAGALVVGALVVLAAGNGTPGTAGQAEPTAGAAVTAAPATAQPDGGGGDAGGGGGGGGGNGKGHDGDKDKG